MSPCSSNAEVYCGYRTKEEVRDHYISTYINSPNFPLPELASPKNSGGLEKISREDFQARKKRRIEDRREAAKNLPPATPKKKPTASVPACHKVQGYMPGRMEFETEYANDAEEAVQHIHFVPGDGVDPRTGELEPEMKLKLTLMDIYNSRLMGRADCYYTWNYLRCETVLCRHWERSMTMLQEGKCVGRKMESSTTRLYADFCRSLI